MRLGWKIVAVGLAALVVTLAFARWRVRRFGRRCREMSVARCARTDPTDTIFVAIVSRDDREAALTVADAVTKAYCAARVRFGVLQAGDASAFGVRAAVEAEFARDASAFFRENVRVVADGVARAAHAGMSRLFSMAFAGERYALCCDGRAAFCVAWDAVLLAELAACRDPRAVVTGLPPRFSVTTRDSRRLREGDAPLFDPAAVDAPEAVSSRAAPTFLAFDRWGGDDRLPRFRALPFASRPVRPTPCAFWCSRFSFSSSAAFERVPFDPRMRSGAGGEDHLMSARLWTHGWNFYDSGAGAVEVDYDEPAVRAHACDPGADAGEEAEIMVSVLTTNATRARGGDARSRMGSKRSYAAFEVACGVRFSTREVTHRALTGLPLGTDAAALRAKHGDLRQAERLVTASRRS